MNDKPPLPVCNAFLVCRQISKDPHTKEQLLAGLPTTHHHHHFPTAMSAGIFARLSSAHGDYLIEAQLETQEGKIVWKDGPPEPWPMHDPLKYRDISMNLAPVFPKPGSYDFVLLANGDEVARQRFTVSLSPQGAGKQT